MSDSKILYFAGEANWCKHRTPDEKYGRYTIDLYMDDKSWDKFERSGIQLKPMTNNNEKDELFNGQKYVKFKRDHSRVKMGSKEVVEYGPPKVFDEDGADVSDVAVGNGSKVTIKVRTYPTSMGIGCQWDSMRVEELVKYEEYEVDDEIDNPF